MKSFAAIALVAGCLCAASAQVRAQTARPPSQNAQAMQQLQQLASERTQLQAEVSKLKAELEAARKERDSLKAAQQSNAQRSRGAEAELLKAQADKARVDGDLAREKQRVEELVTRFRETAATMRDVETDRATKGQLLAQREQELGVCVDHNNKLLVLNGEIIDKLENQGFWSAVGHNEPFTKIKRSQLENLADDYRNTAQDNRVSPAAPPR